MIYDLKWPCCHTQMCVPFAADFLARVHRARGCHDGLAGPASRPTQGVPGGLWGHGRGCYSGNQGADGMFLIVMYGY